MVHFRAAIFFLPYVLANKNKEEKEPCRLWLAKSTLTTPSSVRYGLYAGIDFEKGDILPDVELAIPYIDFFVDANKETPYTKGIVDYLETSVWTKDYLSAKFEGNFSAAAFIAGVGVLANYHSLISNADWLSAASFLRERGDITKPGKPHISRGAISEIVNVTMVATRKIPAGMEIHPFLGDLWDKQEISPYQDKITRGDVVDADKVVDQIVDFYDRYESQMSDELKENMLDFMLDKILGAAGGARATAIRSLIPQNYRKIRKVKEAGGTFMYRVKDTLKKTKWFERNGVCVDTMYAAKSTIPDAGRGAFASRNFKVGERITLIPTLLLGQRDLMDMFDLVPIAQPAGDEQNPDPQAKATEVKYTYDISKKRGQQLGINYAFGHPESSLLLIPTSPMVNFINHKRNSNAKLQWSTHQVMGNDQATWEHSVQEVMKFQSNMVVLEIEAVKDIKKGEEIFIDYGEDWEQAWDEYKNNWEKYKKTPWPLRAEDFKTTFKHKPFPIESQGEEKNIIPANILTACYIQTGNVPDGSVSVTTDGSPIYEWVGPTEYKNYTGALLTLCELKQVIKIKTGSYNYTVTAQIEHEDKSGTAQVNNVPHSAVTLVDAPYTSDLHFAEAFRHFIGIPDEMFPQSWRDLR